MPKLLSDDEDSNDGFTINKSYADNYDKWRRNEVQNKLKAKYGDDAELDDTSSSEDDETCKELTEEIEKDFYKAYALIKQKDPKIYNKKIAFFKNNEELDDDETEDDETNVEKKPKKEKPMYYKDYERKLLMEKGGFVFDDKTEDNETELKEKQKKEKPMYIKDYERKMLMEKGGFVSDEEDEELKKSNNEDTEELNQIKQINNDSDDDDELFFERKVKKEDEENKQDYLSWLAGETENIDEETASSLQPLKSVWDDSKLNRDEKFLKDYLLNKRYLNKTNDRVPTYDEIVQDFSDDEEILEKQEDFEHKYNFRYEEPDQDFIKRYPRTMEHSLRKEDDRRKIKRVEVKERKAEEKKQKVEDLKKLRELKLKEIEEKIEKLKEITGNDEMEFNNEDIDGDFDPEEHDKRMQALFNDEYYEGPEEDQKPKFDLDDEDAFELETENYDNWTGNDVANGNEKHCEDDDFNMDADYDPKLSTQQELIDNTRKRKKRKRKSKFTEMLSKERPKFDPNEKKYEDYLEEYYKLDCEDFIDNIPCRFKYKSVIPNDFGLSTEDILIAKDRELNRWCSLKKAVQIRSDEVEKYDQIAYSRKGQNINLKKKFLPSLFTEDEEESKVEENVNEETQKNVEKKKIETVTKDTEVTQPETSEIKEENQVKPQKSVKKKKVKIATITKDTEVTTQHETSDEIKDAVVTPTKTTKKKKNKKKKSKAIETQVQPTENEEQKKVSKKRKNSDSSDNIKKKKFKKNNKNDIDTGLTDARLKAYGINPKKFKKKIKNDKYKK